MLSAWLSPLGPGGPPETPGSRGSGSGSQRTYGVSASLPTTEKQVVVETRFRSRKETHL